VIAVDPSEAALERYLAAYAPRYRAACKAFDFWDDMAEDWGPVHDRMIKDLLDRYDVRGSLIQGTRFRILECLTSGRACSSTGSVNPMAKKKTAAQRQRRVDDTRAWRARQKRGAAVYPVKVDGTTFNLLERFGGLDWQGG
jgi:hypothetical protein